MNEALIKIEALTTSVQQLKKAYLQKNAELEELKNKNAAHEEELQKLKNENEELQMKQMEWEEMISKHEESSNTAKLDTEKIKTIIDSCLKDIDDLLSKESVAVTA